MIVIEIAERMECGEPWYCWQTPRRFPSLW